MKIRQTALIVPTYNASPHWREFCEGIRRQSLSPQQIIIIDSSSMDGTPETAREAGFTVIEIDSREFNHGGTRQIGAEFAHDAEVLIYLTQDAIPCDTDAFARLVVAFDDPEIGAAYGRQLPRPEANSIETHSRLFNYPPESRIRSWNHRRTLGFKSIFFSNSFGAYRTEALMSVGGFKKDVIFGEDTLAVGHMHRVGWKTAYVADALVCHSHSLSIAEEFRRYFDIGGLHARERWLIEEFGAVYGEGRRYVLLELKYLLRHDPFRIPSAILRTLAKFAGYKLGKSERRIAPVFNLHKGKN